MSVALPLTVNNPCAVNNGGCSHLCLIRHGGREHTCECPDHFLTIQIGGVTRCLPMCTSTQYRCANNERFVKASLIFAMFSSLFLLFATFFKYNFWIDCDTLMEIGRTRLFITMFLSQKCPCCLQPSYDFMHFYSFLGVFPQNSSSFQFLIHQFKNLNTFTFLRLPLKNSAT